MPPAQTAELPSKIFVATTCATYMASPFLGGINGWPGVTMLCLVLLGLAWFLMRAGSIYVQTIKYLFSINIRDATIAILLAALLLLILKHANRLVVINFPLEYNFFLPAYDPLMFLRTTYENRFVGFLGVCSIAIAKAIIGDVLFRWIIWQPSIFNSSRFAKMSASAFVLTAPEIGYGSFWFASMFLFYALALSAYFFAGGRIGRTFLISFFVTVFSYGHIYLEA